MAAAKFGGAVTLLQLATASAPAKRVSQTYPLASFPVSLVIRRRVLPSGHRDVERASGVSFAADLVDELVEFLVPDQTRVTLVEDELDSMFHLGT